MADGGTQKCQVLAKIVHHLKTQFLHLEDRPLSIEELLEEIYEVDVTKSTKKFLAEEALPCNPNVKITDDGKYVYKPPLPYCNNKKGLLGFLKSQYLKTSGGILKDDIIDSVHGAETMLRTLAKKNCIVIITRVDKKEVVFYNDRSMPPYKVDESLIQMYRSITLNGMDDDKIEKYLTINRLNPMKCEKIKKNIEKKSLVKRKRASNKQPRDNIHVADQLLGYRVDLEDSQLDQNTEATSTRKRRKTVSKSKDLTHLT